MRFLIALVLLVSVAAASRVARPHVRGYQETKAAMKELSDALDSLAYVFTVKGVKTQPLCGLSVPSLGPYAARKGLDIYEHAPKKQAGGYFKPGTDGKLEYVAGTKPAAPSTYTGGNKPEDAKFAVVKYPNKKALDNALLEASAEIVADDAQVRAKIAEIKYLEIKDKALREEGNKAAAAIVEEKLRKERAEALKEESKERVDEEKREELKTETPGRTVVETKAPSTDAAPTTAAAPKPPKTCNTPAGRALCDNQGRTLYIGPGEEDGKVRCTGECAVFWPFVPAGSISGDGIGSVRGPTGKSHATYNGRPLYRFDLDPSAGSSDGHNSNGFEIATL